MALPSTWSCFLPREYSVHRAHSVKVWDLQKQISMRWKTTSMWGSSSQSLCIKMWPCQSFRAVKVACKQDFPLTWLKYISLVMVECIFLVAAYWACLRRQWSVSFLSLLISDAFFCCCFPALERDWVDKRGIPAPTGGELISARRFNDYGDKGVKVTWRDSKCSDLRC